MLMQSAFENGIRVLQVSGRISPKSFFQVMRSSPFSPLLQQCSALLMQSIDDADRIIRLKGIGENSPHHRHHEEPVSSSGAVGAGTDTDIPATWTEKPFSFAARLVRERKIFCCMLTAGSESARLALKLILAPRHWRERRKLSA